jgi:hypothetical protein
VATTYVGTTASAPLLRGRYYRMTLASDPGPVDEQGFIPRARNVWEELASTRLAFAASPFVGVAGDTVATFDIKATGTAPVSEIARWIEGRHYGTVHVARLELLREGTGVTDTGARDRVTDSARAQQASGDWMSKLLGAAKGTTLMLAIVALAVLAVYAGVLRGPRR